MTGIYGKSSVRRIRRRRRRRQRFKRMLPYIVLGTVIVVVVACLVSVTGASRMEKPQEPAPKFGKLQPKEIVVFERIPETAQESQKARGAGEAYILTRIAMAEAEGEDTEGKALVILTVLNRVEAPQFPGTIAEVVEQRNAFSSYSNGRYDRV